MTQRSSSEMPYLSIGEVLGLLLEEFSDVTISKIRFLESQGLIVPERTASGYRKFYDSDIERLRFILREQKDKFLPLRVIKDRLTTPPEGLVRPAPRGIKNVVVPKVIADNDQDVQIAPEAEVPITQGHPSRSSKAQAAHSTRAPRRSALPDPSDAVGRPATYSRLEILSVSGLSDSALSDLESFGLLSARQVGQQSMYDEHALALSEVAKGFIDSGFDVRHLKAWKLSASREADLFEQRVLPVLRRRSPESRQEADVLLTELSDLGARLRAILLAQALGSLRDHH